MPTITLQVGQCGNQVGQQLWTLLEQQLQLQTGQRQTGLCAGNEFFREASQSSRQRRRARCVLVDTEPKVVRSLLRPGDNCSVFSSDNVYLGQSGRGNNWAYGYSQLHVASGPTTRSGGQGDWDYGGVNSRCGGGDESCTLDNIMNGGVRREAEACDAAPNFLLLHSLGGGSGAGLGSRILEAVREEYPRNYVAALSVAPHTLGDAPLQALNAVMALSFLQAYADVVVMYDNSGPVADATRTGRQLSMADINMHIAGSALGWLWPLDSGEVAGGASRIRDMVCSVAPDPCLKLVQARTAPVTASFGPQGLWHDGCKALARAQARYDSRDCGSEVAMSSCLLIGRALSAPPAPTSSRFTHAGLRATTATAAGTAVTTQPVQDTAMQAYVKAVGGSTRFVCPADVKAAVEVRETAEKLAWPVGSGSAGRGARARAGQVVSAATAAVTAVVNSSAVIGSLEHLASSARRLCDARAYMHWFERHGCSVEAVLEAASTVQAMADSSRLAHGVRNFL